MTGRMTGHTTARRTLRLRWRTDWPLWLLWAGTWLAVALLVLIVGTVLVRGAPVLSWRFLVDAPSQAGAAGGIGVTILGTLAVAVLGVLLAAPLGVGAAVYLVEYTREGRTTRLIRAATEALAGVPSIVLGLFGFALFVRFLGLGWSVLSGALTLACMILPTVVRTSEEALRAVPPLHRDVALSLGASRWEAVRHVIIPAAAPGILTGLVLGMGRAVSETAAVIFTAGVALEAPRSLFDSTRTMAVHFYTLTMESISDRMADGTAAVLVLTVLCINAVAYVLLHLATRRYRT